MKIHDILIAEGCISCGACAEICPEVFTLDPDCKILEKADFDFFRDWIEQAKEVCPVDVIQTK